MELTIRGENMNISPEMEDFIQEKLSKLGRYMPNIDSVYVELSLQHSNRGPDVIVAQVTLKHNRGAILRTEEKMDRTDRDTVKAAVLAASDKMYRRISRFKGKKLEKRGRNRYEMSQEELLLAEPLPDEELDYNPDEVPAADLLERQVIRRKNVAVTAMNEAEAIEQMELLGHSFFMFFNADTNSINVIYRREHGGYGLLEPRIE